MKKTSFTEICDKLGWAMINPSQLDSIRRGGRMTGRTLHMKLDMLHYIMNSPDEEVVIHLYAGNSFISTRLVEELRGHLVVLDCRKTVKLRARSHEPTVGLCDDQVIYDHTWFEQEIRELEARLVALKGRLRDARWRGRA